MKIDIRGTIVANDDAWIYELFEIEHTTPNMINVAINDLAGEEVLVEINSPGGDVYAGSEIYTKLKKLNPNVEIVGLAGSAASFIAMAGKNVSISPTAQIMIHNASSISIGDKHEMQHTGEFLDSVDSGIAYAYQLKTSLEMEEIKEMMTKETWMNAQQALEKGFVDEIMFSNPKVVASGGVMLPESVVNKVRNVMKKEPENKDNERLVAIETQLEMINEKLNNKTKEKPIKNDWLF